MTFFPLGAVCFNKHVIKLEKCHFLHICSVFSIQLVQRCNFCPFYNPLLLILFSKLVFSSFDITKFIQGNKKQ